MVDLAEGGYATVAQFADWINPDAVPDNAVRLIRSATFLVALACMRNPYLDTPSEADAQPLQDATCAQAAPWAALGIDPSKLGTDILAPVKKSSILDGDVERDTSAQAKAAVDAAKELCAEAIAILTAAGLIYEAVPLFDESGCLPSWGLSGPQGCGYLTDYERWIFQ